MLRLLFITAFFCVALSFGNQRPATMSNHSTAAINELAGWHARATGTEPFAPLREDLALAVLHSTPAKPGAFTLALFAPDRCVDAAGKTLRLTRADYAGLAALAQGVLALPRPAQWRVKSAITCRPIDKLVVPEHGALVKVGVYNWNKETTELQQPIEGHSDLPSEIQTLLALAEEAAEAGRPKNEPDIVRRVRDVLR